MEKYLPASLESAARQTLKDIEVLIINNNSSDGTEKIIGQYLKKYPNFYLYNLKSGGDGGARNEGLKHAKGQYICFLDADDWISPQTCQRLYETAKLWDADVAGCTYYAVSQDGKTIKSHSNMEEKAFVTDALKDGRKAMLLKALSIGCVWRRITKRELFIKNALFFPENIFFEDVAHTATSFLLANRYVQIQEPLFYYRYVPTSISNTKQKQYQKSMFLTFAEMRQTLKKAGVYDDIEEPFEYYLAIMFCGGEDYGNAALCKMERQYLIDWFGAARDFYASFPSDIFRKRNKVFRLKFFFMQTALRHNWYAMPKIMRGPINVFTHIYLPFTCAFWQKIFKRLTVKLFGRRKPKKDFDFSNVSSVLIRPIGYGLGDGIILTSALRSLKTAYPNIKIGVFVNERNRKVFEGSKDVDVLFPLTFAACLKQRKKWQLFLDWRPNFVTKNIILDYILSPQFIISFHKEEKKYYTADNVKNYDLYCPNIARAHLNNYLSLTPLKAFLPEQEPRYFIQTNPKEDKFAQSCWRQNKIKVLLAPCGSDRKINVKDLGEICENLQKANEAKLDFILLDGPAAPMYFKKLQSAGLPLRLAPALETGEFFALVKSADLVLCADSAAVHLAGAFGNFVVAAYANFPYQPVFAPLKNGRGAAVISKISSADSRGIDGFDIKDFTAKAQGFIDLLS